MRFPERKNTQKNIKNLIFFKNAKVQRKPADIIIVIAEKLKSRSPSVHKGRRKNYFNQPPLRNDSD